MTWLLADFALESTGVLVLCAGVVWVLRDHSAAVRHSAWFAGLVIVLALVPLSVVTPVFRLALYPQGIDAGSFLERGRPVAIAESPAAAMGPPGGLPVLVRQPTRPGTGTPSRWIAPALPLVWLIGCLALLARIVCSRIGLGRLRRDARPIADPRIRASMDQVVRGMGPRTPVELLASEAVPTPVAFGVLRPTVMLPIDAGDWSAARLRVVLAHELSHLRRHDPWTHLLAEVARAVHWYNPLAWYAVDRLRHERERACDDEVVQDGSDAVDYADHLVSMARFLACPPKFAGDVLTWAGVMGLEARVSALLTPSLRRGRLTRLQRWMIAGLSIGILGALSVVSGSGPKAARAADRAIVRPTLVRERNAPLLAAESGTTPPSSPGRVAVEQTGGQAPGPEPEVRDGHAILDPPRDPLSDPLSERIELTTSPRLPSPEEIRSFKEGDFIARLVVAARHEKGFEHDLVRERAEWALAQVEGGEIVAPLLASLEAGDWRVQSYAAWALATIGATRANPSLGRLLDHPNWRVRAQASSSLAVLGADVPIVVLARLAKDPAWQVRMEVVEFLRRRDGTTGRSLLADMLDDPHAGTRMQVEAALAELDSR